MINFSCPTCGTLFSVKSELAGKQARCGQCNNMVRIPGNEPMVLANADDEPAPLRRRERDEDEPRRRPQRTSPEKPMAGRGTTLWVVLGGLAGAAAAGVGIWLTTRGSTSASTPQEVAKTDPKDALGQRPRTNFAPAPWPGGVAHNMLTVEPPGAVLVQETRRLGQPKAHVLAVACLLGGEVVSGEGNDLIVRSADGEVLHTLSGHTKQVTNIAVAPNGKRAVSGAADGTARAWDLAAGRELGRCEGHPSGVSSVAITGDGTRAVSCNYYATKKETPNHVFVWDCETGAKIAEKTGTQEDPIAKAFFYPDGRQVLLARGRSGPNQRITLWDPVSGEEQDFLDLRAAGHGGTIEYVIAVRGGERLVTRSQKAIVVVETKTATPLMQIEMPPGLYTAFDVAADGNLALVGGSPPGIGAMPPKFGPGPGPFPGPSGPPPGASGPISGPGPVPLILVNLETGKEVCRYQPKFPNPFFKAAFTADGKSFVTCGGRDLFLWNLPGERKGADPAPPAKAEPGKVRLPKELPRTQGLPKDLEEEPWPEFAKVAIADKAASPAIERSSHAFKNLRPMTLIACLPGERFAGLSYENELTLWGKPPNDAPQKLAKMRVIQELLAVSADGSRALAASTTEGQVLSVPLDNPDKALVFSQHRGRMSSLALSADGKLALTVNHPPVEGQNEAILWETATGRIIANAPGTPDDPIVQAFFAADGKRVLLARSDRSGGGQRLALYLWDPEAGTADFYFNLRRAGHEPGGRVSVFATPDGSRIVTCGRKSAVVIDAAKRVPVLEVTFPRPGGMQLFALSPDGKQLLCGGAVPGARTPSSLLIINLENGREAARIDMPGAFFISAAFTPDNKQVLAVNRHSPPALFALDRK